jgi:lactoylglutathione lyase
MRTILTAYRVNNIEVSADFYTNVGFQILGRLAFDDGSIRLMLNLPGDGDDVTVELAFEPHIGRIETGNGFSHIAIQVDDLDGTLQGLRAVGIAFHGPHLPGGEHGPKTAFLFDPDGYRLELVQWPVGHPDTMTRADFQ